MESSKAGRVFLVVADDTQELNAALHYACYRARATQGRVALLRVIEPAEFQHFANIGNLMRAEAREEAEDLLGRMAQSVQEISGQLPLLYVREGTPKEELIKLIAEEPRISILVLAADPGPSGPGPLVSAISGKLMGQLRIPLTIVPGNLTVEQIIMIA